MRTTQQPDELIMVHTLPALSTRARADYLEMPGLSLTAWQAARLWAIDIGISEHVLQDLVDSGFLRRTREGRYLRSGR
jgi:hypothetical protein